MTCQGNCSCS